MSTDQRTETDDERLIDTIARRGRSDAWTGRVWVVENEYGHGDRREPNGTVVLTRNAAGMAAAREGTGPTGPSAPFGIVVFVVGAEAGTAMAIELGPEDAKRLVNALGEAIGEVEAAAEETTRGR